MSQDGKGISYCFKIELAYIFFALFECLNNKPCWKLSVGIQLVKILTLLHSVGNR